MMLIAYLLLVAAIGFALGYFLGFVHTEAERIVDAYVHGMGPLSLYYQPEVWR